MAVSAVLASGHPACRQIEQHPKPQILMHASIAIALVLGATSCGEKKYSPEKAAYAAGKDLIIITIEEYRYQTRGYFTNRNFQALEAAANQARESKERFKDGSWKLAHLYASLACDEAAEETLWQDHAKIRTEWIKQFPRYSRCDHNPDNHHDPCESSRRRSPLRRNAGGQQRQQ